MFCNVVGILLPNYKIIANCGTMRVQILRAVCHWNAQIIISILVKSSNTDHEYSQAHLTCATVNMQIASVYSTVTAGASYNNYYTSSICKLYYVHHSHEESIPPDQN